MKEIPVYLFTGFLESGKTRFIQETMEDPRFSFEEPTLLLVCEEGIEEYEPDRFVDADVFFRVIEDVLPENGDQSFAAHPGREDEEDEMAFGTFAAPERTIVAPQPEIGVAA